MCVVSMVTDHYTEKWRDRLPNTLPYQPGNIPYVPGGGTAVPFPPFWPQVGQQVVTQPGITPEEVAEFKKLLERAREYDKRNNEPACELKEKQDALIAVAKALGVEISFPL